MTPVRITFVDYVPGKLSCRNNFSGHFFIVERNPSSHPTKAPACVLTNPGTIRYIIRMQSDLRNGDIARSGLV
ncbi:MAG: hypothetical protein OJF51_000543 [Nitrospira sp.]|jgi:hypothetical protein|nr:MAG: hypothetical protein OJF51_000543 [Nitrospira sp.]